jgi:hypothetical protein
VAATAELFRETVRIGSLADVGRPGDVGAIATLPGDSMREAYFVGMMASALGPEGTTLVSSDQWERVLDALHEVAANHDSFDTTAVPAEYMVAEVAGADRVHGFLSEAERQSLGERLVASVLEDAPDGTQVDLDSVFVAQTAAHQLGQSSLNDWAIAAAARAASEACDTGVNDYWDFLTVAGMAGVPSPCAVAVTQELWDRAAREIDQVMLSGIWSALDIITQIEALDSVRLAQWPDDSARKDMVKSMAADWIQSYRPLDADDAVRALDSYSHVAVAIELPSASEEQLAYVVDAIRFGLDARTEVLTQAKSGDVLLDAALLGVDLAGTASLASSGGAVLQLAAATASREEWSQRTEALVRAVAQEVSGWDAAAATVPFLLQAQGFACESAYVQVVSDTLHSSGTDSVVVAPLPLVAQAIRLLDRCSVAVDDLVRNSVIDAAEESPSTLNSIWAAQGVWCALDAKRIAEGAEWWEAMEPWLHPAGGAIDDTGFVSLEATHRALGVLLASVGGCQATGVLGLT